MTKKPFFILFAILAFGGFVNCSNRTSFTRLSLNDALTQIGTDGSGEITDTDGDGIPDAVVTDDGTIIPIVPPGATPPPDSGPTPPPNGSPTPPPIRDTSGNCIYTTSTQILSTSTSKTITASDVGSKQNLYVSVTGSNNTITIDLAGASIERLILKHAGNTNRINVKNADLSVGICNEMSGGSNSEVFDSSNSAALGDLQSGTGGGNILELEFLLSYGLRYALSGNNQCIAAPVGTFILSSSTNDNGHTLHLDDGGTCL